MSTNWKRLYGPIVSPDTAIHDILTAPANTAFVMTKVTVSNVTAVAALATFTYTPAGGSSVEIWQRSIPGKPTTGSDMEAVEIEGMILGALDKISFTSDTANALAPMISGVVYTP